MCLVKPSSSCLFRSNEAIKLGALDLAVGEFTRYHWLKSNSAKKFG